MTGHWYRLLLGVAIAVGISAQGWTLSSSADQPPNVPRIDDGRVWAIARGATHIYVGGTFTAVNSGVARAGIAAFDAVTGALDTNWDPGIGNGGSTVEVQAIVVSGGVVYVGGRFETANGGALTRRKLLAVSEADGSSAAVVDPVWSPMIGMSLGDIVYGLAVSGTKVYVGGAFTEVLNGSVTRNNLAAFNLATGSTAAAVDTAWNPNIEGDMWTYFGCVDAVEVYGTRVYVGGDFCTVNGSVTRHQLAAFALANGSNTGTVDAQWNPNLLNGEVYRLAIANNVVYAAGDFDTANGSLTRNRLAAFSLAGSGNTGTAHPWAPNIPSDRVWALAVNGGRVFAGGSFTTADGSSRYYAAAYNESNGTNSAALDAWNPGHSFSGGQVYAMTASGKEGVILGGDFTYFGNWTRYRVASFGGSWNVAPYVRRAIPGDSETVHTTSLEVDVEFNKPVYGVDVTDLVLSGSAAPGASVLLVSRQFVYYNYETYRFSIAGLSDGALHLELAPDVNDIVDNNLADLEPMPTAWDITVDTSGGAASVPFVEGFESGTLGSCWDSRGMHRFRNLVTTDNTPNTGAYHFTMDCTTLSEIERNELTLTANLAGQSGMSLSFWMKEFNDADHNLLANPFSQGSDFDGVAISADGVTWHQIQGLCTADGISDVYQQFTVDLDAATAAAGLTYNAAFKIRFNHYGNWTIPSDGFAFDDIRIGAAASAPAVTSVTSGHADGAFTTGETIDIAVIFDQAVTVSGAPTLDIASGATPYAAPLVDGSGTATLTFRYIVQAGDSATDLDCTGAGALALNGGTIRDAATGSLDATVTLPIPGATGSLGANTAIVIDTTAPTVSLAIDLPGTYTNDPDAPLALAANDAGSGVAEMRFSNDGGTWSGWEAFNANKTWALAAGDGAKTVYAEVRDAAGNVSTQASDTIALDETPPTLTLAINLPGAFTSATGVPLVVSANDAGSGVAEMRFSNNGSAWSGWETFSAAKAWTLFTGDGLKTVYAEVRDTAGNVSTQATDTITLDTTPPTLAFAIDIADIFTRIPDVPLALTANDATSGVAEMHFSNDGATWSGWEAFTATTTWTLETGEGWKTVYAEVRDAAGNVSGPATGTVALDETPLVATPVGPALVSIAPGGAVTFEVAVTGVFGTPVYAWDTPNGKSGDEKAESYTVENADDLDAGDYICQVTDDTEAALPVTFTLELGVSEPAAGVLLPFLALSLAVLGATAARRRKSS